LQQLLTFLSLDLALFVYKKHLQKNFSDQYTIYLFPLADCNHKIHTYDIPPLITYIIQEQMFYFNLNKNVCSYHYFYNFVNFHAIIYKNSLRRNLNANSKCKIVRRSL